MLWICVCFMKLPLKSSFMITGGASIRDLSGSFSLDLSYGQPWRTTDARSVDDADISALLVLLSVPSLSPATVSEI